MTTMAELLDFLAKAESDVVSGNLRIDTPLLEVEGVRYLARMFSAGALTQIEAGDLTVQVADPELDELGYLGLSIDRTATAIAETVRQIQGQAQHLAAIAQELAAAAGQLQASAQAISATASHLSQGTERQRVLIDSGVSDTQSVAGVAETLHGRAQEAERRIAEIAQQARRHGEEIARSSALLEALVTQMDRVADAAVALEQG